MRDKFKPWRRYVPLVAIFLLCLLLTGCYREQILSVTTNFSIEVVNNDYSVPVKVKISNNTKNAESYKWTFTGANPSSATGKDPGTIEFDIPGTYKIKLEAANQSGGSDSKEVEIQIDAAIKMGFQVINAKSWFPDVTVQVNNTTQGATQYEWTFEGGTPAGSTLQQPGSVVFSTPGIHKLTLKAGNGRESYTKDTTITVLPDLVSAFDIAWPAEDNDMEVPFTAMLQNNSISATSYNWSCSGGTPSASVAAAPSITYNSPGTYTIVLTAANDKKSQTASRVITLLPNSNLFRFSDVKLGINTAQNTIGCYFSSVLGKVLKSSEVTASNGSTVDFAFFGLNNTFVQNEFVSPDAVQNYVFAAIPNAINTKIINRQESCGCGSNLSVVQFDAMTNDATLKSITINETTAGLRYFDNSALPRIVLFQTSDGRKGAVKVQQYVNAGQQSYIVCEVKVMKK